MERKWFLTIAIIIIFIISAATRIYRGNIVTGTIYFLIGGIIIFGALIKYIKSH